MKTKLLSILLFLSGIIGHSQIIYSNNNLPPPNIDIQENTLQETFLHLDKTKIPNGLLLDAAVEFINLKKYDGTIPDSSYTSSKAVLDIYNTLLMSRLHSSAQFSKTSDDFSNEWSSAQEPDVVPIAGVFYRYAQFSQTVNQNAQSTGDPGLLTINGNYLEDKYINGVWQNPYEEKYVFALAPSNPSFDKLSFNIVLPENLFLTNKNNTIQKIEYRLADDRPYQLLAKNNLIPVSYAAKGTYRWTFKLTLTSGEILYSHTQFVIDGDLDKYVEMSYSEFAKTGITNYDFKKRIEPYQVPGAFIWSAPIQKAKATLYIKLASGHSGIVNPLIVAEGFDPGYIISSNKEAGETNIDDFIISIRASNQLENLLNTDYDIIYVDWGNGTADIRQNAQYLKQAIQYVNAEKAKNGSTIQNVVLGQSMGGLVARYALKDMEDLGQNHDTKLFITHDSPHLGANIPIGLQYMLVNIFKTYIKTPAVAGFGDFIIPIYADGVAWSKKLGLTNSPAARQMLINYVNSNYQVDNTIHNQWQTILKEKGYPQIPRKVAISNGSECGTDQVINDFVIMNLTTSHQNVLSNVLSPLVGLFLSRLDMLALTLVPGKGNYTFDVKVKPILITNEPKEIYKANITYNKKIFAIFNSSVVLLGGSKYQPQNILPYDKFGGGRYIFDTRQIPAFVRDKITINSFAFIPTPSALDYKMGNTALVEADYQKSFSPVDDASNVPFSNFVAERMGENNQHISFSQRNGDFIINQLSNNTSAQNQKITTSYLCGSRIQIGGNSVICGTTNVTYTTGFAPNISWTVLNGSNLIDITSPLNQPQIGFTPKTGANGLVTLQAYLSGDGTSNTATKNIWIGKPKVSVTQINNPNYYNESHFYLNLPAPASELGITQIKWSKLSSTDPTARLYAGLNSTSGYARGYDNSWTMDVKVEVTNACGTTTEIVTILPPPFSGCDGYKVAKSGKGNNAYIIIDPCAKNSLSKDSSAKMENLNTEVTNVTGNRILSTNTLEFDLSNQLIGTYYVRIIKNNKVVHTETLLKK